MKRSLDSAYCPYCGRKLRKHTHKPCSGCKYETGGEPGRSWPTIRDLLDEERDIPGLWVDVDLALWTKIVRDAIKNEEATP